MFKKASLKIMPLANNSATTSSSNQDVRPIQCLLTAEKAVLQSLQKLSDDYAKASEALRTWGLSEDNDLGSILTASTSLFNHFSSALAQYVSHGHTMQRQLEVMAKKGESLDSLKQRRKSVHQKAEDTAHQLNRMNPDNKYYAMHAEALKRLRKDVRKMDEDIRLEETILIDHKQTATKVWMRLKFGGLYECCEKGSIAGKYGKLVTTEFEGLEDINQPGMPRNVHLQSKIESFIVEADRYVNAVGLSFGGARNGDRNVPESPTAPSIGPYTSSPTGQEPPHPPPKPQDRPQNGQPFRSGNGQFPEGSSFPPSSGRPYGPSSHQQPQLSRVTEGAVDDFGVVPGPSNGRGQFGASESGGQSLGVPVVGGRRHDTSDSNAGPSRLQDPSAPSHWQPTTSQSQWQNPYQYPVHMRPPISSESGYPPQDPPSQGGRRQPTSESYSAGPSQWQNQPVVMRPPVSSESAYPPSQGGSNLLSNPSYSAGPSSLQSPPRPVVSSDSGYFPQQGGSQLNGNSSYSAGPSHLQSSPSDRYTTPTRPPVPPVSGRYALHDPPLGGRHPNDSSSGGYTSHDPPTSQWQNHPSERFQVPPPPPALPSQGPSNASNPYSSQAAPLDVRQRPGGSPSESITGTSQWTPATNRFSSTSQSTSVNSEGRGGEGSYTNQSMHSWGSEPEESPPAYVFMDNPEDTGL